MKKIAMLTMLVSMLGLTACNTMAGLGRDVEKAGDKVEDAARDCQDAGGCND